MEKVKKISKILSLIGGILGVIAAAGILGFALILFIAGGAALVPQVKDMLEPIFAGLSSIVLGAGLGLGFVFLIMGIFALISGIFAIKGFKEAEKGLFIKVIVFAILGGLNTILSIAGAIMGLVVLAKEKKALAAEEALAEEAEAK